MGILFRFDETSDDLVFRENLSGFGGFGLGFLGLVCFVWLFFPFTLINRATHNTAFLFSGFLFASFCFFLYDSSTESDNPATSQTTRD